MPTISMEMQMTPSTSGNADKLKSMISSDPDTVVSFFSGLFKNLYTKMSDLSQIGRGLSLLR